MKSAIAIISKSLNDKSRTGKVKTQIGQSFIFKGINILVGFFYVPLLIQVLGQEKYGIWLTLSVIFNWMSLFDLGLGNGLRNKLTPTFASNNDELGKIYVSTTYFYIFCIFIPLLFIFLLCNQFINWQQLLNTSLFTKNELVLLTSTLFSMVIIRLITQNIVVIYQANQKSSIKDIVDGCASLLSFLLILFISKTEELGNLLLVGLIISGVPVLIYIIISQRAFNREYQHLKPSFKYVDLKAGKGIFNLGANFFFLQISAMLLFMSSNFFVAQLYGPKEVVIYNSTYKYFQIFIVSYAIIANPIWSAVTDAFYQQDYLWLKRTLKKLKSISIIFSIGILIMLICSNVIFHFWLGSEIKIPYLLKICMAAYAILLVIIMPFSVFLNGIGKIQLTTRLTYLEIVIYLVGIYCFDKLFHNSISITIAFLTSKLMMCIIQVIQVSKILNKKAKGIWYK
ncbi:lipopolysaccharide biosynthesis protein [Formosa sp. S-31]|uniref:lipopolysaccharide biosynthesis protein n=1 Tax=Formosa sp. S-31 TaxID=2790949 RepID=UPI003EB6EA8E